GLGTASPARPEARRLRGRRAREEATVLALGGPDGADGPTIDPGRGDAGEEPAVETRIVGHEGAVAAGGIQLHEVLIARTRPGRWQRPDAVVGGASVARQVDCVAALRIGERHARRLGAVPRVAAADERPLVVRGALPVCAEAVARIPVDVAAHAAHVEGV